MVRRRLKHKEVVETMKRDDLEVAREKTQEFWNTWVSPYGNLLWGTLIAIVLVVSAWIFWTNKRTHDLDNANAYLAESKRYFQSGDTVSALTELNYILPGGSYSDSRLETVAKMSQATIAYASGDYESAISSLTDVLGEAPPTLKPDLIYQLSNAQEANGDYPAALESLDEVVPYLGEEPADEPYREASVWDRYYYRRGRLLARMGQEAEATENLLKVSEKSRWNLDARSELAWMKAKPAGTLPTKWSGTPSS
jgi:tetratricopeptide (TPR) repeat protein